MEKGLVSIIVAVYNTAQYIEECIESVLNQTYCHWELILVDDGSTDNSGEICEKYRTDDRRIRVIHQKNGGQSKARNEALKICNGEFYVFLDSDDRLTLDALEVLCRTLVDNDSDIACGGIIKFGNKRHRCIYSNGEDYVSNSEEACKNMFIQNGLDSNTFAKIYKSYLWQNIIFPEGSIFEDVPIMYKIILRSNKVSFCKNFVYEQRSRVDSTTRVNYSDKRKVYVDYSMKVYEDIKCRLPKLSSEAYVYYLTAVIDNYISISCSRNVKEHKEYREELYDIIQKNKKVIKNYTCLKKMISRIIICKLGAGRVFYTLNQKLK